MKKAYRSLSKQHQPDKNPERVEEAEQRMRGERKAAGGLEFGSMKAPAGGAMHDYNKGLTELNTLRALVYECPEI